MRGKQSFFGSRNLYMPVLVVKMFVFVLASKKVALCSDEAYTGKRHFRGFETSVAIREYRRRSQLALQYFHCNNPRNSHVRQLVG